MPSTLSLLMVSPLNNRIHTKLLIKAANKKEDHLKLQKKLMFPLEIAMLYKLLLLNNQLLLELMLKLGNSTLEELCLLQDAEPN